MAETAAVRRCGDHRPGLGRDWCHMDGEWCYQDDPCRGCTIVILQARVTALEAALAKHCLPQGYHTPDIATALAPDAGGTV